jgi:hypothetical protein
MPRVDVPPHPRSAAVLAPASAAAARRGARGGQPFSVPLGAQRRTTPGGAEARTPPLTAAAAARSSLPRRRRPDGDDGVAERPGLVAPWQIREGPPRAAPRERAGPALPAALGTERVRLGIGPRGAEARLRIEHGPLAGAEIHLRHLPGGIEAVVLTGVESSRQTLAVVMEEVARRLQRRGYAFRAAPCRQGEGGGPGRQPPPSR